MFIHYVKLGVNDSATIACPQFQPLGQPCQWRQATTGVAGCQALIQLLLQWVAQPKGGIFPVSQSLNRVIAAFSLFHSILQCWNCLPRQAIPSLSNLYQSWQVSCDIFHMLVQPPEMTYRRVSQYWVCWLCTLLYHAVMGLQTV